MTGQPLSFWSASRRVFDLSLGEMLWSRRTLYVLVIVGAPLALAAAGRIIAVSGRASLSVNGADVGGTAIFGMMVWGLFVRFTVPVGTKSIRFAALSADGRTDDDKLRLTCRAAQ